MADGMREKTTNVGGVIKRIWYAMTGAAQGAQLLSLDDTGKLKCVSEQITGLAGTGNRMVVADSSGGLSASFMAYTENSYTPTLSSTGETGSWTYTTRIGKYVCIGNKLTIHISIGWSAKPSAGTSIKISLPARADVYALRGFLGEYSGITFTGKQLGLSNGGTDSHNIYLFQDLSGGNPADINVSDISSSGYINCVIETLVI